MSTEPSDAASASLGSKLQTLYETLPPDEQRIVDFILQQAADHVVEHGDVQGYNMTVGGEAGPGTQDAMKRVLFGAAGVTGGLATPGAINWLVASARDANLFS